jgi:hypothetical protein
MGAPRFNHVAMSVPSSVLDDAGRAEIVGFYRDVFGWEEMPTMTKPGERLVLQAYSYDQFVFLIAEDEPMSCPRMDHFGMSVDTLEELHELHGRAKAIASSDERVDLIDVDLDDFGFLKLHSFYVRFLLPMMVEVQHWEWAEGAGPG